MGVEAPRFEQNKMNSEESTLSDPKQDMGEIYHVPRRSLSTMEHVIADVCAAQLDLIAATAELAVLMGASWTLPFMAVTGTFENMKENFGERRSRP